jgi:hypothetical protein
LGFPRGSWNGHLTLPCLGPPAPTRKPPHAMPKGASHAFLLHAFWGTLYAACLGISWMIPMRHRKSRAMPRRRGRHRPIWPAAWATFRNRAGGLARNSPKRWRSHFSGSPLTGGLDPSRALASSALISARRPPPPPARSELHRTRYAQGWQGAISAKLHRLPSTVTGPRTWTVHGDGRDAAMICPGTFEGSEAIPVADLMVMGKGTPLPSDTPEIS